MAERTMGKPRRDTGHSFIWALALFGILCGVLLMFLGNIGSGTGMADGRNPESVKAVIIDLDAATNALEDNDYGRTKAHLRSARRRLAQLDK